MMKRSNDYQSDTPDKRETIVAYLDGELELEARREVEQQLAEDPQTRSAMRELQKTWDLLDNLPSSHADDSFTQTTLEMIVGQASEDQQRSRNPWHENRLFRWLGRAGGIAAAFVAGYFVVAALQNQSQRNLLQDLPLIEQLDYYSVADSVEFLERLDGEGIFPSDEIDESNDTVSNLIFVDSEIDAIQVRVNDLTDEQKESLNEKRERFDRMPPKRQNEIRHLHDQLINHEQPNRLRHVMIEYQRWLASLDDSLERGKIRDEPLDKRLARIRELRERQQRRWFGRHAQLKDGDLKIILDWFDEYLKIHHEKLDSAAVFSSRRHDDRRPPSRFRGIRAWQMGLIPFPTKEDIDRLQKNLSSDARRELQSRASMDDKTRLVQEWVTAAVFATVRRGPPSQERLRRFYEHELTQTQRDDITQESGVDTDKFQRRLEEAYRDHRRQELFGPGMRRGRFRGPDHLGPPDRFRPEGRGRRSQRPPGRQERGRRNEDEPSQESQRGPNV